MDARLAVARLTLLACLIAARDPTTASLQTLRNACVPATHDGAIRFDDSARSGAFGRVSWAAQRGVPARAQARYHLLQLGVVEPPTVEPAPLGVVTSSTSEGEVVELVGPAVRARHDVLQRRARWLPPLEWHDDAGTAVDAATHPGRASPHRLQTAGCVALRNGQQQTVRSAHGRAALLLVNHPEPACQCAPATPSASASRQRQWYLPRQHEPWV